MVRDYLRSREGCLLVAPFLISDADPDPVVSEPFWSDVDPTKKVMKQEKYHIHEQLTYKI